MVQVALGPDASGESVRHAALHLALKRHQNKSTFFTFVCKHLWKASFFFFDDVLVFGGLLSQMQGNMVEVPAEPQPPSEKVRRFDLLLILTCLKNFHEDVKRC